MANTIASVLNLFVFTYYKNIILYSQIIYNNNY